MTINFGFNPKSQRYHYLDGDKKGQFLPKNTVRNVVSQYINDYNQDLQTLTRQLTEGGITLAEWESKVAKYLKEVAINVHRVAKPNSTQSDYGKVGAHLKTQYSFLRNFSQDIASGNLSEAQINARAAQYLQSTWTLFNTAVRDAHTDAGYKWERRLQQSKHPCMECTKYAGMGWQMISTLPKIGEQCECKNNCRCYFDFSQSLGKPQERLYDSLYKLIPIK